MTDYDKFCLKRLLWLFLLAVGVTANLTLRSSWAMSVVGLVAAVVAASEHTALCENWRYRDVVAYLKKEGVL